MVLDPMPGPNPNARSTASSARVLVAERVAEDQSEPSALDAPREEDDEAADDD
ncbi:MAG: hypothetical protein QOJ95_337, partial [Mycobacterium sp.]|nr:hypothetical protein [Mycobacterium sp.]